MNIFFALFLIVGTQAFAPSTVKKAPAVKALEYSTRYDNAVSYNRPSYSEGYGYGNRYGQSYGGSRGGLGNGYGYGDRSVSRSNYNLDRGYSRGYGRENGRGYQNELSYNNDRNYGRGYNNVRSYNQGGYGGYNQRSYNQRSYSNRMGGYGGNGGYGRGYSMNNVRLEVDGLPSFHELYEHQDNERQERNYDNGYSNSGRQHYNRDYHVNSNNNYYGQDYYGYNNYNRNDRYY